MIDISKAIRFEESSHTYWLDGARVPSITQAMEPATFDDFDFVDPRVLQARAEEGTTLARMVELYEKHGSFEASDHARSDREWDLMLDLLDDLEAYLDFKSQSGARVTSSERIVASRRCGFAGRMDLTALFPGDDDLWVIDIKRTATPPRSGGIQTAGQEIALRETDGLPDSVQIKRGVLHLRRGKFKLVPHSDPRDKIVFLSCLNVTKWREK